MAILSADKKSVTVQKNDTLWDIAEDYLGSGSKYQELASINGIKNPNIIYVGQVIKLTKTASSSNSTVKSSSNKAVIEHFGIQSNSDNTLYATWVWTKSNTENYEYQWLYDSGDNVWFIGSDSSTEFKQCTYSYPSNAKRIAFKVKPISKTYTSNDKTTSYWTAEWSTTKYYDISSNPPKQPESAPEVRIENLKLTTELSNLDVNAASIQFQIVKDNSTIFNTGTADIKTNHASYSCNVTAGSEYKVRCRSVRDKIYSSWTDYSGNVGTAPSAPSGITSLKAIDDKNVQIEWGSVKNATSYTIQYTTKLIYFDTTVGVTSTDVDAKLGSKTIIAVNEGGEYFFRIRAVNNEGESAWTATKSVAVGKAPIAPTTWSSTNTAIVGEDLTLYWVHNSQDGSSETFAQLYLDIDGKTTTYTIENNRSEEEKDKTHVYNIDTTDSKFVEGSKIKWKVRTAGATKDYGEWSVLRIIDIYAPPTLELNVADVNGNSIETLTSFPFYIYGLAGPKTQQPIGYHVTISANEIYETVDNVGNPKTVNKDEAVYSKYFDINDELLVEMSAGNINLDNNISYTVRCVVSMNSGLTAESSKEFTVSWADLEVEVNAEINIDTDSITASIRPYCETYEDGYFKVRLGVDTYEVTDEAIDIYEIDNVYTNTGEIVYIGSTGQSLYYCIAYVDSNGNSINPTYYSVISTSGSFRRTSTVLDPNLVENIYTTTGEQVLLGKNSAGSIIHYCLTEQRSPLEGVILSVYRREFDGSFTELATGIPNTKETFITDPHPALDYARYRIVGIIEATGAVSYADLAGVPVGEKAVIIQWDEQWSNFNITNEDEMVQPSWSGSLLKLPYNVDVSDSNTPDVSLVSYIGRKRPVSYYGTQIGETSSWNVEIDKRDEETLYALRRLALWMGDVYVREPSGSGYWANITVSFSQKHCEVTIPVSFNITRVEGGI